MKNENSSNNNTFKVLLKKFLHEIKFIKQTENSRISDLNNVYEIKGKKFHFVRLTQFHCHTASIFSHVKKVIHPAFIRRIRKVLSLLNNPSTGLFDTSESLMC